jgi:hypothetical protein
MIHKDNLSKGKDSWNLMKESTNLMAQTEHKTVGDILTDECVRLKNLILKIQAYERKIPPTKTDITFLYSDKLLEVYDTMSRLLNHYNSKSEVAHHYIDTIISNIDSSLESYVASMAEKEFSSTKAIIDDICKTIHIIRLQLRKTQ